MYLSSYWALLLGLSAFPVIWFSLRRRGYTRRQLVAIAVLRALTVLVIVLILCGAHLRIRSARRHHIFLVDVSDSFAPNLEDADHFVRNQVSHIRRDERVTTIAFAGGPITTHRGPGGALPQSILPHDDLPPTDRTDLAAALAQAASLVDATEAGTITVISDGLSTEPVPSQLLCRLRRQGMVVNAVATRPGYAADLRVLNVDGPDSAAPGESFNVRVTVFCEAASRATMTLTGPQTDVTEKVQVRAGVPTSVTLSATAPNRGFAQYQVTVSGSPDPVGANNRLKLALPVRGKREVLIIGPARSAASSVASRMDGFTVRRVTPTANRPVRLDLAELARTHLVVLDNVPAEAFSPAALETLRRFVENVGGGLIMLGGPQSFASGGWADSDVEQILPVWCDPRDTHKQPLALALLLDASGSMAEGNPTKMELTKRAALSAVTALKENDLVGVTAFRIRPEVLVPLGPAVPAEPIRNAVFALVPSGGTDMYPALLANISALMRSKPELRHLLIVSDGKSRPGDSAAVLSALQRAKVTLSAVATGAETDREILRKLSTESGGRFYEVRRMSELTRIFLDDLRRIEGPLTRTGATFALKQTAPLPFAVSGQPAAVTGYNRLRAKQDSTVVWQSEPEPGKTEPVLVLGRVGLGSSAVLASAPGTDWGGPMNDWPGLSRFLADLFGHLSRTGGDPNHDLSLRRVGNRFVVTVDAHHDDRPMNGEKLLLRAQSSGTTPTETRLTQTAPGIYSGQFAAAPDETLVVVLVEEASSQVLTTRVLTTPYPDEYRRLQPDLAMLKELADSTGGRLFTEGAQLAATVSHAPLVYHRMTWPLIFVLLVLFSAEAILRGLGRI